MLQPTPTARIFKSGSRGTSFHNDYCYGHGERSITVWVPLFGLEKNNSFYFVRDEHVKEFSDTDMALNYSEKMEKELLTKSDPVLLNEQECIYFGSKEIHGSPENTAKKTRFSFDFRMGIENDGTSTKALSSYYKYFGQKWVDPSIELKKIRFLKYICGGKGFGTMPQHVLIEGVSDFYNLNIVGNEGELERFGNPVLLSHLEMKMGKKDYDAIIISSSIILNNEALSAIKKSSIRVFSASEERFLN